MAKGIFMSAIDSIYDDLPEERYHFPRRYLNLAQQCVGDWILYYEPRGGGGRMRYFATARVDRIERDPAKADHFYASVTDYLELPRPVPYREGNNYYEGRLRKNDGSLNKGLLGWAIHHLEDHEYQAILTVGMSTGPQTDASSASSTDDDLATGEDRPVTEQILLRPYRDRAFSRLIRSAYHDSCALTGLCLLNGGGHAEVEAAHIQAVEDRGPDSTRNGIAMSRTLHWSFDHGILSLEDDGRILVAKGLLPEQLGRLLNPNGYAQLPDNALLRPHPHFLRFHRENRFKG